MTAPRILRSRSGFRLRSRSSAAPLRPVFMSAEFAAALAGPSGGFVPDALIEKLARQMALKPDGVTSPELLRELDSRGLTHRLRDRRFTGALFKNPGWRCVGTRRSGGTGRNSSRVVCAWRWSPPTGEGL